MMRQIVSMPGSDSTVLPVSIFRPSQLQIRATLSASGRPSPRSMRLSVDFETPHSRETSSSDIPSAERSRYNSSASSAAVVIDGCLFIVISEAPCDIYDQI